MEKLGIIERLKLLSVFGAGNHLLKEYISDGDPCGSYDRLLHDDAIAEDKYAKALRRLSDRQFESVQERCTEHGIRILTPDDGDFPQRLLDLEEPPLLLFVYGDISCLRDKHAVAVVGSRKPSEYSVSVTRAFAGELASRKAVIISGFARGIDTAAHRAALDVGGATVAVLGSGTLYDYPKGTMRFKKEIAERGAVISEYLPTEEPDKPYFIVRNRLISGLADCTLVAEASKRSGALNTAWHAAQQGKDVFVIPPHDLLSEQYLGQSGLLYDGAELALHPSDIYERIVEKHDFY